MAEAKKVNKKLTAKTALKTEVDAANTGPVEQVDEIKVEEEKKLAKAGKRSHKAVVEQEEKAAKEARKVHSTDDRPKDKPKVKPARSRLERRGKKFREAAKLIDVNKEYTLIEASELAIKSSSTNFDASVELHVRLSVDPKQADQNIRDTVVLPSGTGKNVRVAFFGEADDVKVAKAVGADIAGSDDFLQQLDKNQVNFDILIATPTVMAKLGKYARLLGPKGLMPNPKSGTVTKDVKKAIEQAKAGRVEYRVDSTGIVHVGAGKVSFGSKKIEENLRALLTSIKSNKPASVKANYVRSIYVTTSMGPSIKVSISEL